ncbi:DUF308 domain-containing protein [Motilimonas eburnea]|uniref:DUF308 domain-containing protein n=1 Tax=Motilimonas eburnea TaxID=1737488 RepID=UPI001E2B3CFF|nr:DUF308 domain-containing protein [Motilimonas eburnea]MCE2572935.1 DUF308 domain-containing protein [Motilimonas eburnea]
MQLYTNVPKEMQKSAKLAAILMMVIGALAVILPVYFATLSVMILGVALLACGGLGWLYNRHLSRCGINETSNLMPLIFCLLGLLLLLVPSLTLSVAGLIIGVGLIFSGVMGWLTERRIVNPSFWWQLRHGITALLGLVLILSGATGAAWLIGVLFGLNILIAGANVWLTLASQARMP